MLTVVRFLSLSFISGRKLVTVLFVLRNRKLDMLLDKTLYLKFLCELIFIGQQIYNVSRWTRNCPNLYTHETYQPNL